MRAALVALGWWAFSSGGGGNGRALEGRGNGLPIPSRCGFLAYVCAQEEMDDMYDIDLLDG